DSVTAWNSECLPRVWFVHLGIPMKLHARPTIPLLAVAMASLLRVPVASGLATASTQSEAAIGRRLANYPQVKIGARKSKRLEQNRALVSKLIEAADILDQIYLRQVDVRNPAQRTQIAKNPARPNALAYFDLMKGPWDEDGNPVMG